MALSIGKLTILVGAGILGSVLAKEGRMPSVSDVISGTFKILKPLKQSDSASSSTKRKNDALVAQVNSLRQELQILANSRPVTIVTGGAGGRRYGVIVLCVVVGYGYIWWKGWKLPDITFATKRSLSDACNAIAKQLEQVYSSISATKRDLSSRIDRADCSLNDLSEENSATRQEVSLLCGEMETFDVNIQSVREVVETLESRIHRMQGNEDAINTKVMRLVGVARNMEQRRSPDALQGTPSNGSRPALGHPQASSSSRTLSLPPQLSLEPLCPTSDGSKETQYQPNGASSAAGLKDIQQVSNAVSSSPKISNGNVNSNLSEGATGSATGGFFSRNIITGNIPFISRARSATHSSK